MSAIPVPLSRPGRVRRPSAFSVDSPLCVIIPVFNEAATIREILRRVLSQALVGEVIVVDDGSTDETVSCLASGAERDPRVTLLQHPVNRGKGAAIRTALTFATTPWILIQDADLEYEPGDYGLLWEAARDASPPVAVYGSRFLAGSVIRGSATPSWHRIGNQLLSGVSNLIHGQRLTDEATCLKLIPLSLLRQMDLCENGFGFCPEVTAKLGRLGVRVVEVPVHYRGRSRAEGKKIRVWHGFEALWCLLRYRCWSRRSDGFPGQVARSSDLR